MASRVAASAALVGVAAGTINLAITDCGDSSTHGHVNGISPSSVEQGTTTVVSGAGHLDTAVSDGDFTTNVKAAGVSVASCKGDICSASSCQLPAGTGSVNFHGVACPLAAGDVSLDFDVSVSKLVPSSLAHLDIEMSATGSAGKLLCAKLSTSPGMKASVDEVPLTMTWGEWKDHFGMTFNGEEDSSRQSVFEANVAFIESENAKGSNTYTLGVNHFSHLTEDEFIAQFTGLGDGSALGPDDAHMGTLEIGERASSVDWSTNAAVVNPVKDQGQCGSCWAFSAVGTVESGYALAAGKLGSYSEQQLVDCDTSMSQGCNGGFNQYGISYMGQAGACSESAYPYKAADGTCQASSCSKALAAGTVTGYNSVTASTSGLESALNQQPVSVTVRADNSWQSYRSGTVSENCPFLGRPNHAVIGVGYDGENFKIRNSWGQAWGEGGYIRVSKSGSNPYCLWTTTPFVPTISAEVTV